MIKILTVAVAVMAIAIEAGGSDMCTDLVN